MIRWKNMLKDALQAIEVVTFDYPYFSGYKKRAPRNAEKLVEFHKNTVKNTVSNYPGHPLILAGKSMGSRVSCMVAAEDEIESSAIICLGYPLMGSQDGKCPLEKLQSVCKKMKSQNELHVIDGGDHSFEIGKKHLQTNSSTQEEAEEIAVRAVASFVSRCLGGK